MCWEITRESNAHWHQKTTPDCPQWSNFIWKISADLHEFTSKMQITGFPRGSKRKVWRQLASPLSWKQKSHWFLEWKPLNRFPSAALHSDIKSQITWTQAPLRSLQQFWTMSFHLHLIYSRRLLHRLLRTGDRSIAGGMGMLLFQRKPRLGGKWWGFPGGSEVKSLPAMQENCVRSLGWVNPLEKGKATHSSILAWRIPWTEEPGGLQFTGSQRVGHDWSDLAQTVHGGQGKQLAVSSGHTWEWIRRSQFGCWVQHLPSSLGTGSCVWNETFKVGGRHVCEHTCVGIALECEYVRMWVCMRMQIGVYKHLWPKCSVC